MLNFIEIPASKNSISKRNLVYGIGINDSNYNVARRINGKPTFCPFYNRWADMIRRCYSEKFQIKSPTYNGCSVCSEWLTFSNFRSWMESQNWQGNHLDKDIINPGNKIYSKDNCCFISHAVNCLFTGSASTSKNKKGVKFDKRNKMYMARVSYNGDRIYLGIYKTPEEALSIYIEAKVKIILEAAYNHSDPRVSNGLKAHANLLLSKI